jgi:hypothetical protein
MKTMKKLYILITLVAVVFTGQAQKINSYILKMSSHAVTNAKTIAVTDFNREGEDYGNYGDDIAVYLKNNLNHNHRGISAESKKDIYNPWLTTELYQLVDDPANADIVLSGTYSITATEVANKDKKLTKEAKGFHYQLPYSYFSYALSNTASIEVMMNVYKREVDKVVFELPYNKEVKDVKTANYSKPRIRSKADLVKTAVSYAMNAMPNYLCPTLVAKEYDFRRVKTKDKELKESLKNAKKLLRDAQIKEAGKIFLAAYDAEKDRDAAYNVAMCYELIGNYTKANEYYIMSGDEVAKKAIEACITHRDLLIKMLVDIQEEDF